MRLAGPLPQPGEDAEDLGVPLRAEYLIVGAKSRGVVHARRSTVAGEHRLLQRWSDAATGILEECDPIVGGVRSEEHTSELQSLMRTPYAAFWLAKKTPSKQPHN